MQTAHQDNRFEHRPTFVLALVAGYYLPIGLLWGGVIPFGLRYPMLILIMGCMVIYSVRRRYTWASLGFRRDTLKGSLLWNTGLTCIGAALLLGLEHAGILHARSIAALGLFYPFYVFFSSPVQEFLFRSLLFAEMKAAGITHRAWQVMISAVTFGAVHLVYHHSLTTAVTFLIGLFWGAVYARYPNFWGVMLSHAALGALAITSGLI